MHVAIPLQNENSVKKNVDHLMLELDRYRRQSEWLSLVNELHARLASELDLPSMIEAFSVWLMPLVEHDLMAFQDADGKRQYVSCSCHGPARRSMMSVAKKIFKNISALKTKINYRKKDYYLHKWAIKYKGGRGHILLLRKSGSIKQRETRMVRQALSILDEPLRRALDYEELYEQASRDPLTGLENRRVFEQRIAPMFERACRHGCSVTLASMDLDRFKQINDSLGHAAGDKALRRVAQTMAAMVRNSDLLVRMGGDEFLLVLSDTDAEAAQNLAERLCRAVEELDICSPDGTRLGISIGLVEWQDKMTMKEWLLRADEVLYQAKASGRSRVCVNREIKNQVA